MTEIQREFHTDHDTDVSRDTLAAGFLLAVTLCFAAACFAPGPDALVLLLLGGGVGMIGASVGGESNTRSDEEKVVSYRPPQKEDGVRLAASCGQSPYRPQRDWAASVTDARNERAGIAR